MNNDTWDSMNEDTQNLLMEQSKIFADKAWDAADDSAVQGIACLTGERAECRYGDPSDMILVPAQESDEAFRKNVLEEFVLKRFAERCGAECAANWAATAGAVAGVTASE